MSAFSATVFRLRRPFESVECKKPFQSVTPLRQSVRGISFKWIGADIGMEARMKGKLICALCTLIALSARGIDSSAWAKGGPDVFWLDEYGNIAWEDEKVRLDNFAIQLMNDPNLIGYYYVRVGKESCRGEGQARAIRAKNYMTKVRHVDWARIIWRDIGYGDDFLVSIWLSQRGKAPKYVPEYQRATADHIVKECGVNPLVRRKVNSSAANKRMQRSRR